MPGVQGQRVGPGRGDEAGERRDRIRRCHVVVGAVDVQERAGDRGELARPVGQEHLAGEQAVVPAELADHLDERGAGERDVVVGPV